jgi:serine/threonine-protein kinase
MSQLQHDPLEGSGKYRVISELGRGGMGEVFLGEHASLGNKVVIKLLHAELSGKSNLVDRMRLEAQACARLNHPNIVRVTDFDRTPSGRPFFVMEYLPGRSLSEEAEAAGGVLPVAKALDFVTQALEGLAVAHAQGLVHRDIKLDNLFVCAPGTQPGVDQLVKILDFGVAKVLDTQGAGDGDGPAPLMVPTGTGVVVGTPRFFAPEQARGKPLDHRADIYAMGLVLYTLVAGRGPFDDCTTILEMAKAHVMTPPPPPSHFARQPIPPELDAAVLRAIAKQPEQRFQSASEFAQALKQVASGGGAVQATAYQQPTVNEQTTRPVGPQAGYPAATSTPQTVGGTTGGDAPTAKMPPKPDPNVAPTAPMSHGGQAMGATQAMSGPAPGGTDPLPTTGGETPPGDGLATGEKRYSVGLAAVVVVLAGATGAVIAFAILQLV